MENAQAAAAKATAELLSIEQMTPITGGKRLVGDSAEGNASKKPKVTQDDSDEAKAASEERSRQAEAANAAAAEGVQEAEATKAMEEALASKEEERVRQENEEQVRVTNLAEELKAARDLKVAEEGRIRQEKDRFV